MGTQTAYSLATPALIYRGVWKEGDYEPGDTCTYDGQLWHCNTATSDMPGGGTPCWTLAVRRGRDGRSNGGH